MFLSSYSSNNNPQARFFFLSLWWHSFSFISACLAPRVTIFELTAPHTSRLVTFHFTGFCLNTQIFPFLVFRPSLSNMCNVEPNRTHSTTKVIHDIIRSKNLWEIKYGLGYSLAAHRKPSLATLTLLYTPGRIAYEALGERLLWSVKLPALHFLRYLRNL